ncbi:MAG: helicase-related protein [Alphaproteobacteria bacterium]|nr:helicase-related protein [Alphaproteobacteria bacterium]
MPTDRGRTLAVLGPTNTGKTHFAMERMLAYESGMIGFPLRLLARENYERAVAIKGSSQVALITGEEKILPPRAKYFMCTAESMPLSRPVAFLALDEVQMCADPDRGHIFTERLLRARGQFETMFMGAETMRPLIRALVPDVEFQTRPRMSTLSYTGPKKTARLPARSALVAFSAPDVYAIAELVRRQRGGAALVMGALSPRTRNAQVAMFQDGEVDYLVATDAIGMGLNMDIDHVCFTSTRKFDGHLNRALGPTELAQIAGRAGRHMADGTFGTTTEVGGFEEDLVQAMEDNEFEPLRRVYWRNWRLDFQSTERLRHSLALPPDQPSLVRAREADDERTLRTLLDDPDIAKLANNPDAVRLLWEVCRVPDFRKVMSDAHARLLSVLYRYLRTSDERIPTDWIAGQIKHHDRMDGDIDTLTQRIAGVRTLIYIAYRADWLADTAHWQDRTRAIEDRLSDTLHDRLTQRFVDRRTAVLVKRLKDKVDFLAAVKTDGEVIVEGHPVGHLDGFKFLADTSTAASDPDVSAKAIDRAAGQALRQEIETRVAECVSANDDQFVLRLEPASKPAIHWKGARLATVAKGGTLLAPQIKVPAYDLLSSEQRDAVTKRLARWLSRYLETRLGPLYADPGTLPTGPARGILFQLREHLGSMPRAAAVNAISGLERKDRQLLRRIGVRIERESVLAPALLKPAAVALRGMLYDLNHDRRGTPVPSPGRMSVRMERTVPDAFYEAIGYRPLGKLAVRVDIVERVAAGAWELSRPGAFPPPVDLMNLIGCGIEDMTEVLKRLGYRHHFKDDALKFRRQKPEAGRTGAQQKRSKQKANPNSPFAKLGELMGGQS